MAKRAPRRVCGVVEKPRHLSQAGPGRHSPLIDDAACRPTVVLSSEPRGPKGPQMAHYDVFRERLAIKYPALGHALWDPRPTNPDRSVQVGDVGFTREGRFHRLFNALLPADDPSHYYGVPEYHVPFTPIVSGHIVKGTLNANNYCSAGVGVEAATGIHLSR